MTESYGGLLRRLIDEHLTPIARRNGPDADAALDDAIELHRLANQIDRLTPGMLEHFDLGDRIATHVVWEALRALSRGPQSDEIDDGD